MSGLASLVALSASLRQAVQHDFNFILDQGGYNTFLYGQGLELIAADDSRLLLRSLVTEITHDEHDVIVTMADRNCILVDFATTAFSLGVLKSGDMMFTLPLLAWKNEAIQTFQIGAFTNIFFRFSAGPGLWNRSTELF